MEITFENYMDAQYDIFRKFSRQNAVLTAGDSPEDFRCLTIGWGALGNVWGGGPTMTVYVTPQRYTFDYLMEKDTFTVCFFPEQYHGDVMTLGTKSGRDGDKVALTSLTPIKLAGGVGFAEAELTFTCKKIYADRFDPEKIPEDIMKSVYTRMEPHWFFLGRITDAFGKV